jgi:hypothetical protein
MLRRVTLLLSVLALALPSAALAQSDNPFGPLQLPPVNTTPPDAPTTTSSSSDGGGLKSWQEVLIILAGGILIAGIGWAIVADARSVAPKVADSETRSQAKARQEADLKRRKAQARAANRRSRAARKRNR